MYPHVFGIISVSCLLVSDVYNIEKKKA